MQPPTPHLHLFYIGPAEIQPEAERLESEQREVEAQRKRYAELRDTLMAMKKGDGDGYEALVNLGNDIFAEAEVSSQRPICS